MQLSIREREFREGGRVIYRFLQQERVRIDQLQAFKQVQIVIDSCKREVESAGVVGRVN